MLRFARSAHRPRTWGFAQAIATPRRTTRHLSCLPRGFLRYSRRTPVADSIEPPSGRAATGGLILNDNKRPGSVSAGQEPSSICHLHPPADASRQRLPREATMQQADKNSDRSAMPFGAPKPTQRTRGRHRGAGRDRVPVGRCARGGRCAAGQADAGLAHQHRTALARSAASRRHRDPRQFPDGAA